MKQFSMLFLAAILLSSCKDDYTLDLPVLDFEEISIQCYPSVTGTVITNDTDYQVFQDEKANDISCENAEFPTIDFTQYALVGIQRNAGCRIGNRYFNAYHDETNRKYIIQAITEDEGKCLALVLDRYWALIPIIPSDYTVEFVEE